MDKLNYNRIKELLARQGRANTELAAYMGVRVQTVSGWCTNSYQPELPTLFKIADFLEVEASELLTAKKDLKAGRKKGNNL